MRRSASELIRNLEMRIARLEKKSYRTRYEVNLGSLDISGKTEKYLNKIVGKWIENNLERETEIYEVYDFYIDSIVYDEEDFRLDIKCQIEYAQTQEDDEEGFASEGTKEFTLYLDEYHVRMKDHHDIVRGIERIDERDLEDQFSGFENVTKMRVARLERQASMRTAAAGSDFAFLWKLAEKKLDRYQSLDTIEVPTGEHAIVATVRDMVKFLKSETRLEIYEGMIIGSKRLRKEEPRPQDMLYIMEDDYDQKGKAKNIFIVTKREAMKPSGNREGWNFYFKR